MYSYLCITFSDVDPWALYFLFNLKFLILFTYTHRTDLIFEAIKSTKVGEEIFALILLGNKEVNGIILFLRIFSELINQIFIRTDLVKRNTLPESREV